MTVTAVRNADEVVAGPGLLLVAPIGTSEPSTTADLDTATLPSTWREVGYTEDGSTFSYKITSDTLEVAEELDSIRTMITGRQGTVAFQMAQPVRENLALALNMGAAEASDNTGLEPPDEDDMLRVMLLHISNDASPVRGVLFRKVFNTAGLELNWSKAPKKSLVAVEFSLEKPSAAKPFKVYPNSNALAA